MNWNLYTPRHVSMVLISAERQRKRSEKSAGRCSAVDSFFDWKACLKQIKSRWVPTYTARVSGGGGPDLFGQGPTNQWFWWKKYVFCWCSNATCWVPLNIPPCNLQVCVCEDICDIPPVCTLGSECLPLCTSYLTTQRRIRAQPDWVTPIKSRGPLCTFLILHSLPHLLSPPPAMTAWLTIRRTIGAHVPVAFDRLPQTCTS